MCRLYVAMSEGAETPDRDMFAEMDTAQQESSCQPMTERNTLQTLTVKGLAWTPCLHQLKISMPKLHKFLNTVAGSYNDLPFHNVMHARDVVGKVAVLLTAGTYPDMTALEQCALIIGAAVHDLDHFGMTNADLVKTKHPLAAKYPDSPMESHHCECLLDLLKSHDLDFTCNMNRLDRVKLLFLIKMLVMSTDIGAGRLCLQGDDFARSHACMKLMMRCADIGHCASPWHVHFRWAERLCQENAGEGEKFMSGAFKKSQLVFMQKVACPAFEKLAEIVPETQIWYARCLENTERWEGAVPPELRSETLHKAVEGEFETRRAITVS